MAIAQAQPPVRALAAAAPRPPRRSDDRAFRRGLVIAVVVHAILFLTVSIRTEIEPRSAPPPVRAYTVKPSLRALDLEIVDVGSGAPAPPAIVAPRTPVPVPGPVVTPPLELPPTVGLPSGVVVAPPVADPGGAAVPGQTDPLSPLQRLSRGYGNPEIFGRVDPLPLDELSERDILRLRLEALIAAGNDSAAAEAAARTRATDWTVKDGSGNRWGISPGKIHLGKITLPLPFAFSAPPGRREEVAAKVRSWYETQSQSTRIEAEQTFQERVRATRERNRAQRDSTRRGGGQ